MTKDEIYQRITKGPLLKSILLYSLPLMIGSLIQVLFNAADIAVLGNMGTDSTVASVGATTPIVSLLVNTFVGISGGANLVLARKLGAGDGVQVKKAVDTSIVSALAVGILAMVIGLIFARPLLIATDCPVSCLEGADLYLKLYIAAVPAIMLYNFGAAIIRVSGDSRRPMIYLILSGLLNVVLNIVLCIIWSNKVAAVGTATLSSNVLGAFLVIRHLMKSDGPCRFRLSGIDFDFAICRKIFALGIPCALNSSLYSISNLQIQAAVNSYGESAISGATAAISLESLVAAFIHAFGIAITAFVGQNIGAGNRERVKKTIITAGLISFALGVILGDGLYLLGHQVLSLYIPGKEEAIAYGLVRMKYILAIYWMNGINNTLSSTVQVFGYPSISTANEIVTVLIFRAVWMKWIYPAYNTIHCLYFCYTCSWTFYLVINIISFTVIYNRYRQGKLKQI